MSKLLDTRSFDSIEQISDNFKENIPDDIVVHYAYYQYRDYSGSALVLFSQGDKLYEVNGSHCSCYGLEGQWSPEETTVESLKFRLENGDMSYYIYDDMTKSDFLKMLVSIKFTGQESKEQKIYFNEH